MGLFDLFKTKPAKPSVPTRNITAEDFKDAARQQILPGFKSRDLAVERVRESFELPDEDPRPSVYVDDVWDERLAEEKTWTEVTDYERLSKAFDELEADGILARMNFTCCNTCGVYEIKFERTTKNAYPDYPFREKAYVFFHQQDAEWLDKSPTQLYLTFGAWIESADINPELLAAANDGDKEARDKILQLIDVPIGKHIAATIHRHGLNVNWDGSPYSRLKVEISNWRKPLPAR